MLNIGTVSGFSEIGKVRQENQDVVCIDPAQRFWLIADGMGGLEGGARASQLAMDSCREVLERGGTLRDAANKAQQSILASQQESGYLAMGTTLAAARRIKGGVELGWLGDSRIYAYDGSLQRLSTDHSFVQDMISRGILSENDAREHPKRHLINRYLGMKPPTAGLDCKRFKPSRAGTLMLCSDGVTDYVSDAELNLIFAENERLEQRLEAIRSAVLSSRAGDNASCLLVDYRPSLLTKVINILGYFST